MWKIRQTLIAWWEQVFAAAALELDAIGQVQANKFWMLCVSVRLVGGGCLAGGGLVG